MHWGSTVDLWSSLATVTSIIPVASCLWMQLYGDGLGFWGSGVPQREHQSVSDESAST